MSEPLQIPVDRLRAALSVVLDHLAEVEGDTVALEEDYFWSVSPDERYDFGKEPTQLDVGQLSESWQHLEDLLEGAQEPISFNLVWAGEILQAIGDKVVR